MKQPWVFSARLNDLMLGRSQRASWLFAVALVLGMVVPTARAGGEACCFDDGSCTNTSETACDSQSGEFHPGLTCLPGGDCPVIIFVQACCFEDDSCINLTQEDCAAMGGDSLAGGCINDGCPVIVLTGACCFPDCSCVNLTEEDCANQNGEFHNGSCIGDACPVLQIPAACCLPDGCSLLGECECLAAGGTIPGDANCGLAVIGLTFPVTFLAPGLLIPDNDPAGVSHTINVAGGPFPLGDVAVGLDISHTWVGDLVVTLEHQGTTATLIDRPGVPGSSFGCSENNYDGIVLDDEGAGGPIETKCTANLASPPAYTPSEPLSAFDGLDGSGDWTITIADHSAADTGALGGWSVTLFAMQDDPCPRRCCMDDGTCAYLPPYDCFDGGGRPGQAGTECTPPQIDCPPDVTIECDESTDPSNTGVATATDDCDPNPVVTVQASSIVLGNCADESRITRTWQATDQDGETAFCDQIIDVVDTMPPVLTCPESLVLVCERPEGISSADAAFMISVSDNCDDDVSVTSDAPEILPPTCGNEPTLVTFTAEDNCDHTAMCEIRVEVVGIFCCPGVTDTDLTLLPVDADLRQENDGPIVTKANFEIWNQDERRFSGTERCITCWDQTLLSHYPFPNHFGVRTIHTDKGRARIDGLASNRCPGSEAAPLLAVAVKEIVFQGLLPIVLRSAMVPVGSGSQSATIRYDIVPPTDELATSRNGSAGGGFKFDRSRQGASFNGAAMLDLSGTDDSATAAAGPAVEVGSVSVKGSVLYWPNVEVKWSDRGALLYDTIISLFNDNAQPVWVQLYFVQGDPPLAERCQFDCTVSPGQPCPIDCVLERAHSGWNWVDVGLVLTANQPTYWSAATGQPAGVSSWDILDPGLPLGRPDPDTGGREIRTTRGFVIGWAVNVDGQPIRWNHLGGSALLIDYKESAAAEYNPWAFPCVSAVSEGALCGEGLGELNLDGIEYAAPPDRLIMDFYASGSEAFTHPAAP